MVDAPKHVRENVARWLLHEWGSWRGKDDGSLSVRVRVACGLTVEQVSALWEEDGERAGWNPVERGIISQVDLDAAAADAPLSLDFARLIRYPEVAAFRSRLDMDFVSGGPREPEPADDRFRSLGNLWRDEAFGIGMMPGALRAATMQDIGDLEAFAWSMIEADIIAGRLEVSALRYNDRRRTEGGYSDQWSNIREPVPADEFRQRFHPPLDGPRRHPSSPHSYNVLWRRGDRPQNAPWLDPWVRVNPAAEAAAKAPERKRTGPKDKVPDDVLLAVMREIPRGMLWYDNRAMTATERAERISQRLITLGHEPYDIDYLQRKIGMKQKLIDTSQ